VFGAPHPQNPLVGNPASKLKRNDFRGRRHHVEQQKPHGDGGCWRGPRSRGGFAVLGSPVGRGLRLRRRLRAFGAYGYAPAAYGGVYTYGWPYGVIGDVNYPTYGYAAGCGYSTYGYASGHGPYGYAPNYGFAGGCGAYGAHGYAPNYGVASVCRARRNHGYRGYAGAALN
jgi:hypothetical protein